MVARISGRDPRKACVDGDRGAGDIIHAEGVRVDVPSSAPDADHIWDEGDPYRVGVMRASL